MGKVFWQTDLSFSIDLLMGLTSNAGLAVLIKSSFFVPSTFATGGGTFLRGANDKAGFFTVEDWGPIRGGNSPSSDFCWGSSSVFCRAFISGFSALLLQLKKSEISQKIQKDGPDHKTRKMKQINFTKKNTWNKIDSFHFTSFWRETALAV